MQTLTLFISSPGDVRDERQIAGRVIERLQGKYWSFVRLDDVFWEERAVRATAHYQDELVNPGRCDLVVGILGKKLGSPLPSKFAALSGSAMTGTEWELEEAFAAYDTRFAELVEMGVAPEEAAKLASPDILIYRRKPVPARETLDAAEAAHLDQLDSYLRDRYHFPDGTIKRPFLSYRSIDEFEEKLTKHLEELIVKRLPGLKPGFEPPPISGCPFKGLSFFTYEDSDRFFGRNRQIREVQDLLRERAQAGTAFVLIYGASGYGKSSLMRAGLAPVLTRPGGALDGMDQWRRVTLQPASGTGSLCERLARVILTPSTESEKEQKKIHENYAVTGFPELTGHTISDPDANGANWDVASFARYLADPEDEIFAVADLAGALAAAGLHILLQVDQLEEIFAENVTRGERAVFIRAINSLARCGRVWCLATMRSEYFPRVAKAPELRTLIGRDGGYILPPPDWQSWSEIIRFPALAARLDWERTIEPRLIGDELSTEEWLNDQVLEDVKDNPDALPLLEVCLERLYRDTLDSKDLNGRLRKRDLLTWDSYVAMEGLHGAIATEANQAYESLPSTAKGARDYLFGNLVRVDDTVTRRRADLMELEKKPGAAIFLLAFLDAKLLVTDEEDGRPVITLAHESLLSHWPVLSEWIEEHRSDLAAHQRLIKHAQLWEEHSKSRKYMLAEGHLAEAERVALSSYFLLSKAQMEFFRESQAVARKKLRWFQAAALVFAILAIGAGVLGWVANESSKRANIERNKAEISAAHADAAQKKESLQREIAENETKKSKLERNEAEELIRFLTIELRTTVSPYVPNDISQSIFERVSKYYKTSGIEGRDEKAINMMAAHYKNVGDVSMMNNSTRDAIENYTVAAEFLATLIQQSPDSKAYLSNFINVSVSMATAESHIGDSSSAIKTLEKAISLGKEFASSDNSINENIARAERQLGSNFESIGRLTEALDAYNRAHDILNNLRFESDLPEYRDESSDLLRDRGELKIAQGAVDSGILDLNESLVLLRKLILEYPSAIKFSTDMAKTLESIGSAEFTRGNENEGMRILIEAESLFDSLIKTFPDDTVVKTAASQLALTMANISIDQDDKPNSLRYSARAVELSRQLFESAENDTLRSQNLTIALTRMIKACIQSGNFAEAEEKISEQLVIIRQDISKNPKLVEPKTSLAVAYESRADLLLETNKEEESLNEYERALTAWEEVISMAPENASLKTAFSNLKYKVGRIYSDHGSFERSAELISPSIDDAFSMLEKDIENDILWNVLLIRIQRLLSVCSNQGDYEEVFLRINIYSLVLKRFCMDESPEKRKNVEGMIGFLNEALINSREYKKAVMLHSEISAGLAERLELRGTTVHTLGLASTYSSLGVAQILSRDFLGAKASFESGVAIRGDDLVLQWRLAVANALNDSFVDAEKFVTILKDHRNKSEITYCRQTIQDDLSIFLGSGICHPYITILAELLGFDYRCP